jgi:hypothetical protein
VAEPNNDKSEPLRPKRLKPADLEEFRDALVEAYDFEDLDRRLGYKWGIRLGREIEISGGTRAVFARLIDWTEKKGRTLELLALTWSGNPDNDDLAVIAERLLPDKGSAFNRYERGTISAAPKSLEAVVNKRSRRQDYDKFLARYLLLGKAICKIVTPCSSGTGFLVGRRSVLTNFHVIEAAAKNLPLGERIICHFDYRAIEVEQELEGTPLRLAMPDWLGPNSPYSKSDQTGTGEPESNELDFALLRLAEPAEGARTPLTIPKEAAVVAPGDVVMVAQHAGGAPLAIAWGSVVEFPAEGLRYRYDTTTSPGASGAPLLSADLELIGVHHAAEPISNPRYNQAVPAFLVGRALENAGLELASL